MIEEKTNKKKRTERVGEQSSSKRPARRLKDGVIGPVGWGKKYHGKSRPTLENLLG